MSLIALATPCRGCDIRARRKSATDRPALIELSRVRADRLSLHTWERRHGSFGHLYRLPDHWSVDHDRDRAVDRSILFADGEPADISFLVLRHVLVGLAGRGPHHRAESGDNGSAASRLDFDPIESDQNLAFLFEHDLFRKPVSTFRDHALASAAVRAALKPAGC